jgi:hypothetical protein
VFLQVQLEHLFGWLILPLALKFDRANQEGLIQGSS